MAAMKTIEQPQETSIPTTSSSLDGDDSHSAFDKTNITTNHEIIVEARRNVTQNIWDYITGGAESETTMRRNRLALDSLAFRPRVFRDVSQIDTSVHFLGHRLRVPVMLAPIGSMELITPEGAVAAARAAAQFGTICWVSSVSQPSLEHSAAQAGPVKVFQLYVHGDERWLTAILKRVKDSGYSALCLTVDTRCISNRERPMLSRWTPPYRRDDPGDEYQAKLTIETILACKEISGLPLIAKGIATPEDAMTCVDHGVDIIHVSNHGGRQLDHGQGAMEMLPEIVAAAGGRAPIVFDGGILRGTDVLKAIALGAAATCIGKLQCWGLAAGGSAGLIRALEILEIEIATSMRLLGVTSMSQLDATYICPGKPTALPHEMSSFVHLPAGRIL